MEGGRMEHDRMTQDEADRLLMLLTRVRDDGLTDELVQPLWELFASSHDDKRVRMMVFDLVTSWADRSPLTTMEATVRAGLDTTDGVEVLARVHAWVVVSFAAEMLRRVDPLSADVLGDVVQRQANWLDEYQDTKGRT